MIKLHINEFKQGLFWYACCEIPAEEDESLYYDNAPMVTISSAVILHARGLTRKRAFKKLSEKIERYYDDKEKDIMTIRRKTL